MPIRITNDLDCPICEMPFSRADDLVGHFETHVTFLPSPEQALAKIAMTPGDRDDVMFEVEHLIAEEWPPQTVGVTFDMPLTDTMAESMGTLLSVAALNAIDRLSADRAGVDDGSREPEVLRVTMKISPQWMEAT